MTGCLIKEGLVRGYTVEGNRITILLKYYQGAPVIRNIRVVSKPSRDIWLLPHELKFRTRFNTGLWIMQTPVGVVSHRDCIEMGIGGKVIFAVNNGYQHWKDVSKLQNRWNYLQHAAFWKISFQSFGSAGWFFFSDKANSQQQVNSPTKQKRNEIGTKSSLGRACQEHDPGDYAMAMPWLRLLILWLKLQSAVCQIRILAPPLVARNFKASHGRIFGSTSTFGAPFYGDLVYGRLVYGIPRKENHCTEEDYDVPEPEEYTPEGKSYKEVRLINIILVERGTCSFVTKVKAHAVIIVDTQGSKRTARDIQNIIVADDGYGSTVDIPSVLISREAHRENLQGGTATPPFPAMMGEMDHDSLLGLERSSFARFIRDGPEVSALRLMGIPHSHDFSEGPPPQELLRQMRRLRCPVGLCLTSLLLSLITQAWCAVDGWNVYGGGLDVPSQCKPLKYWLSAYLASTLLPLTTSLALALPLGVIAMATGILVRAMTPDSCEDEASSLWQFINEVSLKGLVSLVGLTIILGITSTSIFPTLRSIQNRWGLSGSAMTEVLEAIHNSADVDVPADTECAICLGNDSTQESWRALPCSHHFHKDCLVDWLNRKMRCPLCRMDLQSAYHNQVAAV
eukprot:symbB.v1.2.020179.t1/scaffold1684.1/size105940/2